jgi:hypothetical protein
MIDLGVSRKNLYSARHVVAEVSMHDGTPVPSTGSGFVVVHDGSPFLVTNRHVVDPAYADSKYVGAKVTAVRIRGYDTCSHQNEHEATLCLSSPDIVFGADNDDVAVFGIGSASHCEGQACALSNWYASEMLADTPEFDSDDRALGILPMDLLAVCGFPELDGYEQQTRPVALVGFIASDPAHRPDPMPKLRGGLHVRSKNIVLYQGFSRSGASGSPILAVQRGLQMGGGLSGPPSRPLRLVGINAGRLPGSAENPSALSYFIRSDSILEALKRN